MRRRTPWIFLVTPQGQNASKRIVVIRIKFDW